MTEISFLGELILKSHIYTDETASTHTHMSTWKLQYVGTHDTSARNSYLKQKTKLLMENLSSESLVLRGKASLKGSICAREYGTVTTPPSPRLLHCDFGGRG